MTLIERCGVFRISDSTKVAFVLDASLSAASKQQDIIALVSETEKELPSEIHRNLYLLGNPAEYAIEHFDSLAPQWFEENRYRASLISPIYEILSEDEDLIIVIIGSGKIFDLDDWKQNILLKRTLLINMGESLQDDPKLTEEIQTPSAKELSYRLYDPVESVHISGEGFMPISWDNNGYRLNVMSADVHLVGKGLDDFSVFMNFFAIQDSKIEASITRKCGKKYKTTVDPVHRPNIAPEFIQIENLNKREIEIFYDVINKQDFRCIYGDHKHSWDELYCDKNEFLGELIYPSLINQVKSGFVFLTHGKDGVNCFMYPWEILKLDKGVVAIKEKTKAFIHRFDQQRKKWVKSIDDLQPYYQLGKKVYAMVIR